MIIKWAFTQSVKVNSYFCVICERKIVSKVFTLMNMITNCFSSNKAKNKPKVILSSDSRNCLCIFLNFSPTLQTAGNCSSLSESSVWTLV